MLVEIIQRIFWDHFHVLLQTIYRRLDVLCLLLLVLVTFFRYFTLSLVAIILTDSYTKYTAYTLETKNVVLVLTRISQLCDIRIQWGTVVGAPDNNIPLPSLPLPPSRQLCTRCIHPSPSKPQALLNGVRNGEANCPFVAYGARLLLRALKAAGKRLAATLYIESQPRPLHSSGGRGVLAAGDGDDGIAAVVLVIRVPL